MEVGKVINYINSNYGTLVKLIYNDNTVKYVEVNKCIVRDCVNVNRVELQTFPY